MFSMILAMDIRGLIGKNNDLPWHYPEDLKYFKSVTLHKKVVMGRKTFESIFNRLGHPLPHRKNVVVTRGDFFHDGIEVINNLSEFLSLPQEEEIIIMGGKQIYEQSIDLVDRMYITHIKKLYRGDTYIEIDYSKFNSKVIKETDELIFVVYERKVK